MSRRGKERPAGSEGPPLPEIPDALEVLRRVVIGPQGTELWVKLATGLFALGCVCAVYLASRPGGRGAVLVYRHAPLWIPVAAVLLIAWGSAWSTWRRPFFQPGRVRGFVTLTAVVAIGSYPLPYPSAHAGRPSRVRFELPVEGAWVVRWGGEGARENRLVLLPDRCFGVDLVVPNEVGEEWGAVGDGYAQCPAYGRDVVAPSAGRVVQVVDGVPDGRGGGGDWEPYGNVVVIEVGEGEFLCVGGLMAGSMDVKAGDQVARRQVLGKVGFSSGSRFTLEPHVALHLSDREELREGEGIPMEFGGFVQQGKMVEKAVLRGGVVGGKLVGDRVSVPERSDQF